LAAPDYLHNTADRQTAILYLSGCAFNGFAYDTLVIGPVGRQLLTVCEDTESGRLAAE
jgi:hypothetical protein|tara:strand:- start:116 stop:289 length:174 start_codon:yes stop_codon:yes gene_type:complete